MSQKQRIANLLRGGPVCGTALLDLRMPRYAARISELRAEGMLIETRVCESHRHASKQYEYVLDTEQMRLRRAIELIDENTDVVYDYSLVGLF